jgi:ectoine hydroxylase-related dioxygenase (phytanoyl-CoA dioxygenase family)
VTTFTQTPWLHESDVQVEDLARVVEVTTQIGDYPWASDVSHNVVLYDVAALPVDDPEQRRAVQAELVRVLHDGPGVFVLRGAFPDLAVIDAATAAFNTIIADEANAGGPAGDHFGTPGANARIWNAQEKLALTAPDVFVRYFANDAIALASEAWLGPNYQMTSQVNLVHPGGQAQEPHRDYHLGFQTTEESERYPAHVHAMSPQLTLQGAVAHCDMPVESGTTMLLPHSQKYPLGYLAWRNQAVRDYFWHNMVQLALKKGDVIFFSPALLHGAGTNHSANIERMANLLQVSSAFGRAMEAVDRVRMCQAVYPLALAARQAGWDERSLDNMVSSCAEGYAFPTNLDSDQPIGGLAPMTQAELMRQALRDDVSPDVFTEALLAQDARRSSQAR